MNWHDEIEPELDSLREYGRVEYWGIKDYGILVPLNNNEGLKGEADKIDLTSIVAALVKNKANG